MKLSLPDYSNSAYGDWHWLWAYFHNTCQNYQRYTENWNVAYLDYCSANYHTLTHTIISLAAIPAGSKSLFLLVSTVLNRNLNPWFQVTCMIKIWSYKALIKISSIPDDLQETVTGCHSVCFLYAGILTLTWWVKVTLFTANCRVNNAVINNQ